MLRTSFFAASACLVFVLALVPANEAAVPVESQPVLGFYFDDPVTVSSPTATTSKTVNLCAPAGACEPAASAAQCYTTFASMADNGVGPAYNVKSDILLTVWLSAKGAAVPLRGLLLQIDGGGNVGTVGQAIYAQDRAVRNETGDPVQLNETAQKVSIAFERPAGAKVRQDAKIGLKLCPLVAGVKDHVDVFLHYGSAAHASGVFFSIDVPAPKTVGNNVFRLSLADKALSFGFPAGTTSKTTTLDGDFPDPVTTPWGPGTADREYTFVTDTLFNATISYPGPEHDAGALVDMSVALILPSGRFNGTVQFGDLPRTDACASAACSTSVFVTAALPTAGAKIAAGSSLSVEFALRSASASDTPYRIEFGASKAPSGFLAAANTPGRAVAGASSTISSVPSSTSLTPSSVASSVSDATPSPTSESTSPTSTDAATGLAQEAPARPKGVSDPPSAVPGLGLVFVIVAAAVAGGLNRRWS